MLREIINRNVVSCQPNTKISEVSQLMEKQNVGSVLVLSNGKPRGIITDRDIVVRCLAKGIDIEDCTVENVMTESVATCRETDGVFDCIQKMRDSKVRRMPVVDNNNKVVGILSFGDLLAVLSKEFSNLVQTTTISEEMEEQLKKVA